MAVRTGERDRTLFRVFTGLLAVLMVGSAARALFDYPWAQESFVHLGYPTCICPLEIATRRRPRRTTGKPRGALS